jgi:hypothetical protein
MYRKSTFLATCTIPDIIHDPVFYLRTRYIGVGVCFHLQVEPTQMGPTVEASICLRFGDRIQCPKRRVLKWNGVRWIMSRIVTVILIYHRHKPIDLISTILDLGSIWAEWLASRFTPRYQLCRRLRDPIASLSFTEKRKIPLPYQESNPES